MAPAITIGLFLIIFGTIEYFMVRSARATKSFTDPAMKSLVGLAAKKSVIVRIVIGTIGALVLSVFSSVIISLIICSILGIKF